MTNIHAQPEDGDGDNHPPNDVNVTTTTTTNIQLWYATQAPNWRARRRRRSNLVACTADLQERLDAAATDLYTALHERLPTDGVTLPMTAVAWILQWLMAPGASQQSTNGQSSIVENLATTTTADLPVLLHPWRSQRRKWQAMARHLVSHCKQVRLIADPWPSRRQPRHRQFVANDNHHRRWLAAYHAWQVRPQVMLGSADCLRFVWLDRVPPECITTLPAATIHVLRIERSAIHALDRLLIHTLVAQKNKKKDTPSTNGKEDENGAGGVPTDTLAISIPPSSLQRRQQFAQLTHLKLVHCGLTLLTYVDDSSSQPKQQQDERTMIRPILPRTCPALQTLNLAHNSLTDAAVTQAGLQELPHLQSVDLSCNVLHGSWQCGTPNWTRLNVSHNPMRHIGRGLVQLYGLETLDVSFNRITKLSSVARLARLPLLQTLELEGNPFLIATESQRNQHYQLLWDLFREARGDDEVLPRIDGQKEQVRMRSILNRHRRNTSSRRTVAVSPSSRCAMSHPLPVMRQCPRRRIEIRTTAVNYATPPAAEKSSRTTLATNEAPSSGITVALHSAEGPPLLLVQKQRMVNFDAWQVLESLPATTVVEDEEKEEEKKEENEQQMPEPPPQQQPADSETPETVTWQDDVVGLEETKASPESPITLENCDTVQVDARPLQETGAEVQIAGQKWLVENVHGKRTKADETSRDASDKNPSNETTLMPIETSIQEEEVLDVAKETDKKKDDEASTGDAEFSSATPDLTSSGSVDANKRPPSEDSQVAEMTPKSEKPPMSPKRKALSLQRSVSSLSAAGSESRASVKTPLISQGAASPSSHRHIRHVDPSPTSVGSPPRNSSFHVAFPDHVWQDESNNSLAQSSTVVSFQDTTASGSEDVKVYEMAENKSTFVGPPNYKTLTIRDNLELYFRMFVFSQALPSMSSSFMDTSMDGMDWQTILEIYPRIQLWPIDRRLRDATTPDDQLSTPQESFCRVWIENVVACGKPALRRLTPNLTARLGFHGELMWSTNAVHLRQEAVSTHRQVILCFSSAAFYVILDHDAVTEKAKNQKRRFPLPLAHDAYFSDAKWPHALARHPFSMLRKVIIGFGFQRVTLRFSNSSFPSPEDFTYVILTGSKMKTVSVLKDLQEVAGDAKSLAGFDQLVIENDDPQVLDALGQVVAPGVIGVVFHYQILEQRWKHGDRPNIRRIVLVTDTNLYLLDEDYLGDGALRDTTKVAPEQLGLPRYRLVDSAALRQVGQLHTGTDPTNITVVIRPTSRLSRTRNWRLVCRDREGQERLVEDIRKAISNS